MSNSQRKKKLAAIKQTEKYLEDQQAKIEIQLEQINEPLNTNFNGESKSSVVHYCVAMLCSVNDPEMMAYFPRIIFYYFLQERDPLSGPFKFSIRTRKITWGNLMNYKVQKCYRILTKVILRTGVEMLFNYGFFLLYSDYFFNIMPEQHIWFGYWLLTILRIAPRRHL